MKKYKILFWVATLIIFLWEGIMPLSTVFFAPEYVNAGTKPLHYPDYFAYALIFFKVLGATALILPGLHPKLKEWAYAGLTFSLVFAVISHVVVDGNPVYILLPIIAMALLVASYFSNQKLQHAAARKEPGGAPLFNAQTV